MQKIKVRVPGSCGELIQGTINGNNFLISCPINLYSEITLFKIESTETAANKIVIEKKYKNQAGENKVGDFSTIKTKKAVQKIIKHYSLQGLNIKINIISELIPGIGMASSTADISGAGAALMLLLKNRVDFELLKKICLSLEPSDSVFLPGIRIFDHLQGKKDLFLAEAPELDILIFKEKGEVDTFQFNTAQDLSSLNSAKEKKIIKAFSLIKKAFKDNDYELLGSSCSLSSLAHQEILFKKNLNKVLKIGEKFKELYGVNIAHSGTIIGLLIKQNSAAEDLIAKIKAETELEFIKRVKMISGGIERRDNIGASAWRKITGSSRKI